MGYEVGGFLALPATLQIGVSGNSCHQKQIFPYYEWAHVNSYQSHLYCVLDEGRSHFVTMIWDRLCARLQIWCITELLYCVQNNIMYEQTQKPSTYLKQRSANIHVLAHLSAKCYR